MMERALDLAAAYVRIGRLEGRCRNITAAAAVLSAALLIITVLKLARLFLKIML
ncbi:MAG: hypothetical protein LBD55_04300 [Treponema sp.]|jgi:hypothetical protein|nr:hypothetical protein [Treponema sp.]